MERLGSSVVRISKTPHWSSTVVDFLMTNRAEVLFCLVDDSAELGTYSDGFIKGFTVFMDSDHVSSLAIKWQILSANTAWELAALGICFALAVLIARTIMGVFFSFVAIDRLVCEQATYNRKVAGQRAKNALLA